MRKPFGAVLAALFLLLTACGERPHATGAAAEPVYNNMVPEPPAQEVQPVRPAAPEPFRPMPEIPLDPEVEILPSEPPYDFGTPLAETEPVDDSHFADAVFIGDSRTEGLQLFSGLKQGTFLWLRDAVLYRGELPKYARFGDGEEKVTMLEALGQKTYGAVYIFTGLNELERSPEYFREKLSGFVDRVLELQPRAAVYLQTVLPIHDASARKSGLGAHFSNAGVDAFNEVIRQVAEEKRVLLLDTAEVYRGEDGQLPGEMTSDGCHFKAKYYKLWAEYLRSHVAPEDYLNDRGQEIA